MPAKRKYPARIETFRGEDLQYWFRLKRGREIVAMSEGYTRAFDRDRTVRELVGLIRPGMVKVVALVVDPPAKRSPK